MKTARLIAFAEETERIARYLHWRQAAQGVACQCCLEPADKLVRDPDGWIICIKCDSCITCGKRAADCECVL